MRSLSAALFATVALLAVSAPAWAKKKEPVDLSAFRGTYHGTLTISVPGYATYLGTATLSAAGPKTGRTLTLTTSGLLAGPTTLPYSNTFTFGKGGRYSSSSVILGLEGAGIPEFGTYRERNGALTYTAVASISSTTIFTSGKLSTRTRGRKQTITLTNNLTATGSPIAYLITFEVSRKIKKN